MKSPNSFDVPAVRMLSSALCEDARESYDRLRQIDPAAVITVMTSLAARMLLSRFITSLPRHCDDAGNAEEVSWPKQIDIRQLRTLAAFFAHMLHARFPCITEEVDVDDVITRADDILLNLTGSKFTLFASAAPSARQSGS